MIARFMGGGHHNYDGVGEPIDFTDSPPILTTPAEDALYRHWDAVDACTCFSF